MPVKKSALRKIVPLAVLISFLVSSCSLIRAIPHKRSMAEGLAAERTTEVRFGKGIMVQTCNGEKVTEEWYGKWAWSDESVKATLPAGETVVNFNLVVSSGSTIYEKKNIDLKYTFEAGKQYRVDSVVKWIDLIKREIGVKLSEGGEELKYWSFGEY